MSYTVLARRYRSDSFDDVVGQEAVAKTLKNAIESDRVAHAYLFTGTRGVGKTTMARILAKALNCLSTDKPTSSPCCKCESCLAISEGADIDVLEIDGASNNGVEQIRELRQNAIYCPARARYKIYIIDEVHMLSTSAFNALLKTLEEPPEHVKFIFATTEANKILPTILSRCQRFDFRNIKLEDIAGHLRQILASEGVEAEDALVRRVARLANGSMRDGLSLLDQLMSMATGKLTFDMVIELLGTPRSDKIIDLAETIGRGDLAGALSQVDAGLDEGLALEQLADTLQHHFRDLMILRNCGPDTDLVDIPDQAVQEKMVAQSKLFDDAALVYYITVLEELRRSIKSSGSGRALLEAAIVRLTATERFSDTKALLEQLKQLQTAAPAAPRRNTNYQSTAKPTRQTTAPQSAIPAQQTQTTPPPAVLTLEYFRKNWDEIINKLDQQNAKAQAIYLKSATADKWENQTLTVVYQSKDQKTREALEVHPNGIAEAEIALSKITGQRIKLKLVQLDDTNSISEPKPTNHIPAAQKEPAMNNKPSPGAKPSQDEINAAVNDPKVKQVMETLNGKIAHIERLPGKKEGS